MKKSRAVVKSDNTDKMMSKRLKMFQVSKEKLYELVKKQFPDVKLPSVDKMDFHYQEPFHYEDSTEEERSFEFLNDDVENDQYLLEYLNDNIVDYTHLKFGIFLLSKRKCYLTGFSVYSTDFRRFSCYLDYVECLEFFTTESEKQSCSEQSENGQPEEQSEKQSEEQSEEQSDNGQPEKYTSRCY